MERDPLWPIIPMFMPIGGVGMTGIWGISIGMGLNPAGWKFEKLLKPPMLLFVLGIVIEREVVAGC